MVTPLGDEREYVTGGMAIVRSRLMAIAEAVEDDALMRRVYHPLWVRSLLSRWSSISTADAQALMFRGRQLTRLCQAYGYPISERSPDVITEYVCEPAINSESYGRRGEYRPWYLGRVC